jgi:hypothetical protein
MIIKTIETIILLTIIIGISLGLIYKFLHKNKCDHVLSITDNDNTISGTIDEFIELIDKCELSNKYSQITLKCTKCKKRTNVKTYKVK